MGLGRLYHARPGALQPLGAGGCADLQLVELVCPPGTPEDTPGGDHQPTHAAQRHCPPEKPVAYRFVSALFGFWNGLTEECRFIDFIVAHHGNGCETRSLFTDEY